MKNQFKTRPPTVVDRQHKRLADSTPDQLHKLVLTHRMNDPTGDIAHHFAMADKVKTIYVNRRQHRDLVSGVLGIVVLEQRHYLVPVAVARQVRATDPTVPIMIGKPAHNNDDIPDDLVW